MQTLTFDARNFLRGISMSDELADGGFSPNSKGINLFASPGLVLPGDSPYFQYGAPAGNVVDFKGVIAWSSTQTNVAPGPARAVSANNANDGRFYLVSDSGQPTQAATDTVRDYVEGKTDMVYYRGDFYITSTTNIALCNYDFSVNDFTWWTGTKGKTALNPSYPHKMCQYGGILYVIDGNLVHSWDGTTATHTALDLPPGFIATDITTYGNLIYISASLFDPDSSGVSVMSRIFTWDGYSDSFIDEFPVQEVIDALIVFGGSLIVTTRSYVGYWNGSTVSPLYPLTSSVYKHQYAITNDRLYLLQGRDILCFGNPLISHPKFFSFPLRHPSKAMNSLYSYNRGTVLFGVADASNPGSGSFNVGGSSSTGLHLYSNKIFLGRYSKIRSVILETEALTAGASIGVNYLNSDGVTKAVGTYSHANFGGISKHEFDVNAHDPTLTVQLDLVWNATPNKGIRRVHVTYEPTERKINR